MAFLRQEYWSALPFPIPGDLLDPGIEPLSPVSPALKVDPLLLSHPGSPQEDIDYLIYSTPYPMGYGPDGKCIRGISNPYGEIRNTIKATTCNHQK